MATMRPTDRRQMTRSKRAGWPIESALVCLIKCSTKGSCFARPSLRERSAVILVILSALVFQANKIGPVFGASANQTLIVANRTSSENATSTSEIETKPKGAQNTTLTASDQDESPLLLVSGEEFVDYTEAPTLLFDSTEDGSRSSTHADPGPKSENATTSGAALEGGSGLLVNVGGSNSTEATSVKIDESTNEPEVRVNGAGNSALLNNGSESPRLDADSTHNTPDEDNNEGSEEELEFSAPKNISQYMDYIEKLFHDLRHQITNLFEPHIPQLIRTSQSVELSNSCSFDMLRMAFALRQFKPWALKMIDSSGKVPEGIFEGSFTALGSYDECLDVVFEDQSVGSSGHNNDPQHPADAALDKEAPKTRGKYCLVTVSPFLPPKPPADKVDRLFQEEANKRNYTKDDQFSRLSPMFYYMKFRIGVCIPSTCEQADMDSISDALSSNLRLNITIPDCRVRPTQPEPFTSHQLYAASIVFTVVALVSAATIVDCFREKSQQLKRKEMEILGAKDCCDNKRTNHNGLVISIENNNCDNEQPDGSAPKRVADQFLAKLHQHWAWMSFSLVTNFRLYFKGNSDTKTCDVPLPQMLHATHNQQIIKCLNGIRVLSLCWVIIANSYLTLDPRATKRLTKTREAPKDFLFQIVVQASLAIETFFFLSGLLMSLSFSRKFDENLDATQGQGDGENNKIHRSKANLWLDWFSFYIHRYIRMTPATMLVIALSMYAYRFGDGPIWFEATKKAHESCTKNWWRHLLHVANYIDTRQMCFIHYWYISADMQLFLFAPIILILLRKYKYIGYTLIGLIGTGSIFNVFHTTYSRNLPPTLLFYSSDPESRREFGNTIMTKPLTHVLPYIVGMLVGQWLAKVTCVKIPVGKSSLETKKSAAHPFGSVRHIDNRVESVPSGSTVRRTINIQKFNKFLASFAVIVATAEIFLPYRWNNSNLPSRFLSSMYAASFRLGWSLVLAYVVISCSHRRSSSCSELFLGSNGRQCGNCKQSRKRTVDQHVNQEVLNQIEYDGGFEKTEEMAQIRNVQGDIRCFCSSGGNVINRLLSLDIFTHLSKLSFVAYLIHLPMMSVFIGQTRGLFAFSHTLVMHLAISYLVLTFLLSFVLVHIIEFPFITFERFLFGRLLYGNDNAHEPSRLYQLTSINQAAPTEDEIGKRKLSFSSMLSAQSKCYIVNNCEVQQKHQSHQDDSAVSRAVNRSGASCTNK